MNKFSLLFGLPEVFVDNQTVAKLFKRKGISEESASSSYRWSSFGSAMVFIRFIYFISKAVLVLIYHLLFH